MADDVNSVALSGRLTRDPEVRVPASGTCVLGFSLAVNESVRDQGTGQWSERANFVDCKVFGRRAEGLARVLSKGALVMVQGRLRWSSWEADDGQRRTRLEVVVDRLALGGGPRRANDGPQAPQDAAYDEDIPF